MLQYFATALSASLIAHFYLSTRLLGRWALSARARRFFRCALWLHALLLPVAMVAGLRAPAAWARWSVPVARVAFFNVGLCLMLVSCLLARDVLLAAVFVVRALRGSRRQLGAETERGATRRQWLQQALDALVLLAAGGQSLVGYARATALARVRPIEIPLPAGAAALSGLRIAHLSDLHIGPTLRGDTLSALVEQVQAQAPDLVAITGDLVDGFVEQLASQVAALGRLRAPLGCYFVTGNHEYFYRAQEWVAELSRLGLTVLLNDSRVLTFNGARLSLSGVCDENAASMLPAHEPDLDAVAASRDPSGAAALRVLLAHRPHCAPRAAALGYDLQLSGHMHGGQFFPLTWLVRGLATYVAGLYRLGRLHLYVNRGAGYWGPPLRHGTSPELAVLTLVARPS